MGNCLKKKRRDPNFGDEEGGGRQQSFKRAQSDVDPNAPKKVKIVLVGATTVGKTCIVIQYVYQRFDENYIPSVCDLYQGEKFHLKNNIEYQVHDTSGDPHLGVNRSISYHNADVFMLCVPLNQHELLEGVDGWVKEIRQVSPDAPIILVGTKSDLREYASSPITLDELRALQTQLGLQGVCETSAKEFSDNNVQKAFNKALTAGMYFAYPETMLQK